jgi:hypothetical protein
MAKSAEIMLATQPIRELPSGYQESRHLVLTASSTILWLNILAFLPMVVAFFVMVGWTAFVVRTRGSWPTSLSGDTPPWLVLLILVIAIIPLHEGVHGLAIMWVGHKPRFGAKLSKMVVYATTDAGLFRRGEFLLVALAPLVVLTVVGMILIFIVPDRIGYYLSLGIILNAGSAIGDLWMALVVLRYPPSSIIRDEEDGIRIYQQVVYS